MTNNILGCFCRDRLDDASPVDPESMSAQFVDHFVLSDGLTPREVECPSN